MTSTLMRLVIIMFVYLGIGGFDNGVQLDWNTCLIPAVQGPSDQFIQAALRITSFMKSIFT
jgi:hypothetical protein